MREGWWPAGTRAPISVVYDPDNLSWQKAIGYQMGSEILTAVFRDAFARLDAAPAQLNWDGNAPSALDPPRAEATTMTSRQH